VTFRSVNRADGDAAGVLVGSAAGELGDGESTTGPGAVHDTTSMIAMRTRGICVSVPFAAVCESKARRCLRGYILRRFVRRMTTPARTRAAPRNGIDAAAVAVDGRESRPSTCPDSRTLAARESVVVGALALAPLVPDIADGLALL